MLELWHAFLSGVSWTPVCDYIELSRKAKSWINLFLSLNGKREGYERAELLHTCTLWLHSCMVARSVVLRKSNKKDSVGDVLKFEHRQWELRMRQREVRKYEKKNDKYWTEDIRAARKRSMPAVEGNDEDNLLPSKPSLDPKTMKLGDLREELKRRGVHGCSRKRKAELIELLQNELKQ
jgi:hypothetical protein